ncbi:glycine zipper 2TM domain-containing protein [Sphingosinicella sp. CPCC 101087]|uniref:glycine zipper 2TM domain-containing protein n=1 Tax=Sphingosinicella sp. CPCC 101087 TaxID=2497754 RepID=UPI00101D67D7|nr:glycine zipper 2TM domain-containing protein [Sphingosinicella sp. CPCC 101087]
MKTFACAAAALALCLPIAPALADPPPWAPAHGRRAKDRALGARDVVWRGEDGRYHCRRSDGTTGLIVGAAVGALLGRELDGGRERTLGTVLGGAAGALAGREIERGGIRCR